MQGSVAAIGTFVSIVVVITLIGRGTPWAAMAALALVAWCIYFYRLLHMAVVVRGDALLARNLATTNRVQRATVADVTLGESRVAKSPNQTVVLQLQSGKEVPLDACARSTNSRRRRRRVDDFYRYLTEWSLATRAPVAEAPAGADEAAGAGAGAGAEPGAMLPVGAPEGAPDGGPATDDSGASAERAAGSESTGPN